MKLKPPKGRQAYFAGGAILLSLALFSPACGGKKDPQAFERPPAPVTVAAAVTRDVPVYLDEVGKCVAREVVSIQPQLSGRITQLHFKDGADVKKGDLLFTIDPRPFEAQLHAAQADLARASAALNLAKSQWTRAETLIATKAISATLGDPAPRKRGDRRSLVRQPDQAAIGRVQNFRIGAPDRHLVRQRDQTVARRVQRPRNCSPDRPLVRQPDQKEAGRQAGPRSDRTPVGSDARRDVQARNRR